MYVSLWLKVGLLQAFCRTNDQIRWFGDPRDGNGSSSSRAQTEGETKEEQGLVVPRVRMRDILSQLVFKEMGNNYYFYLLIF